MCYTQHRKCELLSPHVFVNNMLLMCIIAGVLKRPYELISDTQIQIQLLQFLGLVNESDSSGNKGFGNILMSLPCILAMYIYLC